ncbi:MAG: anhydro-N-acetylmuramic acid kinase [Thermotogae bacterium]|nr:anhydro-N-acetylmuramic acid kinase [Thermotogota bacterium]
MNYIRKLIELIERPRRTILGMMSGTSADGVDLVLTKISGYGKNTKVETLAAKMIDYPEALRKKIIDAMNEGAKMRDVCELDFELGAFFGLCAKKFIESNGLRVDLIASHGQTVYHHPRSDRSPACTLQIGDGDLISTKTGIITVSDFRRKDIAYGGEGAPLVPHVDYILYANDENSIAFNNLGGISNVTYIPKGASESEVIAFDTGPANALIDLAVSKFFNLPLDKDGEISSKGSVDQGLLEKLKEKEIPYISHVPPKSTGKEVYNSMYIEDIAGKPYDIVRTVVELTAWTIWESYRRYVIPGGLDRVVLTGGGVMNKTLVKALKTYFEDIPIEIAEDWKWREAKAFAVLANELLFSNPANNPRATGASYKTLLGKISFP